MLHTHIEILCSHITILQSELCVRARVSNKIKKDLLHAPNTSVKCSFTNNAVQKIELRKYLRNNIKVTQENAITM